VPPTTLILAIESLSSFHSGAGLVNTSRWERLLKKVETGERLRDIEKIQMANNCGSIPLQLRVPFGDLFRKDLTDEVLIASSAGLASILSPHETVELLTHPKLLLEHGADHLPSGAIEGRAALGKESEEAKWLDARIQEGISFASLISSFSFSGDINNLTPGQRRLCRLTFASSHLHLVVNGEFPAIFGVLRQLHSNGTDALALIDQILGNYFMADQAWTTKVLDSKYFLSSIIGKIPELTGESTRLNQYKNIELLRRKISEISDALKMLNDAEPERGDFWRKYISLCHYVEPKRIDSITVATAFAFPTFVVVDYGPKGSAALLYERKTFEAKVRATRRWRDLEFVRPLAPYTNDGRLIHGANWQRQFNEMIVMLLRNGGHLK
jgi:hypothetical protein